METIYLYHDGKEIPENAAFAIDNVVDTFTIEIRSLNGVDAETIKRIIQSRHEVVSCKKTGRKIFSV